MCFMNNACFINLLVLVHYGVRPRILSMSFMGTCPRSGADRCGVLDSPSAQRSEKRIWWYDSWPWYDQSNLNNIGCMMHQRERFSKRFVHPSNYIELISVSWTWIRGENFCHAMLGLHANDLSQARGGQLKHYKTRKVKVTRLHVATLG